MKFGTVTGSYHPGVKGFIRNLKFAKVLLAFSMGVIPLVLVLVLFSARMPAAAPNLLMIGFAFAAAGIGYVVAGKMIDKTRAEAESASQLLTSVEPQAMIMKLTGVSDLSGILVQLWPHDSSLEESPSLLATVKTARRRLFSNKRPVEVQVHLQPLSADRMIAIDAGKDIYWGQLANKDKLRSGSRALKLFVCGFVLLGVLCMGALVLVSTQVIHRAEKELNLARQSLTWPQAPGRIVSSKWRKVRIPKGKSHVHGFRVLIEYEYQTNGKIYQGGLIHFGYRPSTAKAEAADLIARYPVGRAVQIAYDPEHPQLSVLEPGHAEVFVQRLDATHRTLYLGVATSILISLLPLAILAVVNQRRKALLRSF